MARSNRDQRKNQQGSSEGTSGKSRRKNQPKNSSDHLPLHVASYKQISSALTQKKNQEGLQKSSRQSKTISNIEFQKILQDPSVNGVRKNEGTSLGGGFSRFESGKDRRFTITGLSPELIKQEFKNGF